MTMKEIIIPLSRKKITLTILGSMGAFAILFWVFQNTGDRIYVKIVSAMGVVFFGFGVIYSFIRLFNKKPGLVINDEGIIDNSSFSSPTGLIKWENITGVSITETYRYKSLSIHVNNADEIISKQQGFKKILMNWNKKHFNSPIQISSSSLKCNFQDLYNIIKEQLSIRHITNVSSVSEVFPSGAEEKFG